MPNEYTFSAAAVYWVLLIKELRMDKKIIKKA